MSQENVEMVQRWIASLNAADTQALPTLVQPDIEWRDQMHAPDVPEVLYGIAALEQLAAQWQGAYESLTVEVLDYLDAHPWVICVSRWEAKTKDGLAVEVRSVDAYEVEDDRIKRSWGGFSDLKAAQDALGLAEQAMSQENENVEIVRKGFEAFNRGDFNRWVLEFVDPEIEYHTSVEDPDAAIHHGHEGYRRYVEQWQESFDDFRADVDECIAAGDDRVFTWVRWTGLGRGSGVPADWHLAMIYAFRDGKIVRGEEYFDHAEALKAVGLEE